MEVYTTGFGQKSAERFFGELRDAGIRRLVDIRLNNTSQLAGFTKRDDLPFFLREICGAEYIHEPLLAPSPEIFEAYKKRKGSWEVYERSFLALMAERRVEDQLSPDLFSMSTVLLCSEPTAEHCHRRLVLEYLQAKWGNLDIVHLQEYQPAFHWLQVNNIHLADDPLWQERSLQPRPDTIVPSP